jgi:hypothetical protein
MGNRKAVLCTKHRSHSGVKFDAFRRLSIAELAFYALNAEAPCGVNREETFGHISKAHMEAGRISYALLAVTQAKWH